MDELEIIIAQLTAAGWLDQRTGDAARELECRVRKSAEAGELWAQARLAQWQHDGARRAWNQQVRAERRVWVAPTGEALSIPTTYNAAERDDDGTSTGAFTPRQLVLMNWVVLEETRNRQAVRARSLGVSIRYMDYLLGLRDRCPAAVNPLDAMQRLGIDPDAQAPAADTGTDG